MDLNNIIFLILTLAAIAISVYFGLKTIKNKQPRWASNTVEIIGKSTNAPDKLKVLFENKEVEHVSRSNIIFFNNGREVIRKNDITEKLLINLQNARLLEPPYIFCSSNKANKLVASQISNSVEIDFEYLGYRDGAAISILHDGDEKTGIMITGNIIDADIKYVGKFYLGKLLGIAYFLGLFFIYLVGTLMLLFFVKPTGSQESYINVLSNNFIGSIQKDPSIIVIIVMAVVCIVFACLSGRFAYKIIKDYFIFPHWIRSYISSQKNPVRV